MCRASGDATPTSTANPPPPLPLLLSSPFPPSFPPSIFPFVSRSRLFSPPPLSTSPLPSNFFSTPLALARYLRAIARKENRNIEVEPRECHLDDSCRFVHTYTLSLSLPHVRTHAEDVSSLPALARIRGVRYFCPRTRRFLIAHPWTVRFEDVGWWSSTVP